MTDAPAGRPKTLTLFGVILFAILVLWALWHGVIGPRVIEPLPPSEQPAATADEE